MKMKNTRKIAAFAITASVLAAAPAFAHHSVPTYFDVSKTITMEGTIKEFKFQNPHSILTLYVKGPNGQQEEWKAEASLAAWLVRNGWRPDMFKPGDKLTVSGNPARDKDAKMIRLFTVKMADGKVLNANTGQAAS